MQGFVKAALDKKKPPPFIYDEYNVRCFTSNPLSTMRNVPVKLVNAFIKAANQNQKLPRIVVFIPDWDLLKYVKVFNNGIRQILTDVLGWILTQVSRAIQSKKDMPSRHKQGAITSSEPKIIWAKMINRHTEFDKCLLVRTCFNNILEQLLSDRKNHFILDVTHAMDDPSFLSPCNRLNDEGMAKYWHEVDRLIEKFEFAKEVHSTKEEQQETQLLFKVIP